MEQSDVRFDVLAVNDIAFVNDARYRRDHLDDGRRISDDTRLHQRKLLAGAHHIGITVEPAGGSPSRTGPAEVTGELS